MKILVISQMFPSSVNPHFGIFIKREVDSLITHCDQNVIVPIPWKPWEKLNKNVLDYKGSKRIKINYNLYTPLPGQFFLPVKGIWFFAHIFLYVQKLARNFNFDIIHAHNLFPEGVCAVLLKKIFKKPVVISVRGNDVNKLPKNSLLRKQIQYAINSADHIITVSNSLKKRVRRLGGIDEKVSVMAKGVDMELFKPADQFAARNTLDLPKNKIIILSVGWLIPRKNPTAFIETALAIPKENRDKYLFVMVGEGPLKKDIEDRIQKENLNEYFLLPGRVEPSQIPIWMNAADVFTLVSFSEGMPNVIYESMACGKAIIASDVDGAAEILEHGKDGFLVSPHDYSNITKYLLKLTGSKSTRENFGRLARNKMEEKNLNWETNAMWIFDKYSDISVPNQDR